MTLFEDIERFDLEPAKHLDNTYDFYNRSAIERISNVRDVLNDWFEKYPSDEKQEMKSRFKTSFSSAFYELFLHELFARQGFELEAHPDIHGTEKKPDFVVKGHNVEFYLEAKEATDKTDADKSFDNRVSNLYDQINTTNSPDFFFKLDELKLKSKKQPSGKKVIRFLEKELLKHNPETLSNQLRENGFDSLSKIVFEDQDLKLIVSLIPKSPNLRGEVGVRPIGVYPFDSFTGSSDISIKSAIEKKATRYGELDKPYIIAINSTSEKFTDEYDTMNALFGSLQVTFSTNPNNRDERLTRALDGIFLDSKGAKFTRVSGVLVTNIHPGNLHNSKHWLVKHPFGKRDLDFDVFSLSKIVVEKNNIKQINGQNIQDVLGIPENWLEDK